jgi:glycosyltransferase involved in cell wall biosynthesis
MSGFKVAICHQTVIWGDAIGHDIVGIYRLIEALGGEPVIVCEAHRHPFDELRSALPGEADLSALSLLIYHHSQYWEAGERLILKSNCPIVFRYHNITPAEFFAPYSSKYAGGCAEGRRMTQRMIELRQPHLWLAASGYNRDELIAAGASPTAVFVAPPFNRSASLLSLPARADYGNDLPVKLLFVGRLAPNKGHLHLLRVAHAFCSEVSSNLRLTIVGAIDPELNRYYEEIIDSILLLGLQAQVEVRSHCADDELVRLFQEAHVYLTLSEHEGFCVPIVEAQAVGIPVIAAAAAAVGETAGPNQLLGTIPETEEDCRFYAKLIERVVLDNELRSQLIVDGERNVRERFAAEVIENAFVGVLYRLLHHESS